MPEPILTEEAQKQAKHERIRRNLRIIALLLAGYYFVSAGMTYFEDQNKQQQTAAAAISSLSDPKVFRSAFNAAINEARSALPLANADDKADGFVAVLSPALELRGFSKTANNVLDSVQIQTRYPDALPPDALVAFKAFIQACEAKSDEDLAITILKGLEIEPLPDANPDDKIFKPAMYQSEKMRYQTSFSHGPIDELTISASPI